MLATTDVECELAGLVDYVRSGLLAPAMQRRLGRFPELELKVALRDLLDWLSLRSILRGRTASLSGNVHPLTGRIVAQLELSRFLCVPDNSLAYRVEVPSQVQHALEDFVNRRIWHPETRLASHRQAATLELR